MKPDQVCVVKHAECDLWIAERKGTWARWGKRSEALRLTRAEWDSTLSEDREQLVFQVAGP